MIIDWQRMNDFTDPFGGKIFRNKVMDSAANDWKSRLPDIYELSNTIAADPAMAAQFGYSEYAEFVKKPPVLEPLQEFIGELVLADWVDGVRQTLGEIVQVVGIVSDLFEDLDMIFSSKRSSVLEALDVIGGVIKSDMFQMGLDAIGAIPIVGWIIKAVYEIAKVVATFVINEIDERDSLSRKEMAKMLTIPISATQLSPESNDFAAKAFFKAISDSRSQDIILPSYRMAAKDHNMGFEAEGVYVNEGDDMAVGWVVRGAQLTGGLGFVPGTSNITRSLFFTSGVSSAPDSCVIGCDTRGMRDLGTILPTAQNLCTGWWSQVNKPGPSMFSVEPLAAINDWENYIEQMFALAENVMKGWTCAPTGFPFQDKFTCYEELACGKDPQKINKVYKGMGDCTYGRRGRPLNIPKDFGRGSEAVLYGYLCQLYFGISEPFNKKRGGLEQLPRVGNQHYLNDLGSKRYRADALDMSKSVPVAALNDLYENQKATMKSLQCMYVAGDEGNRGRFPAFKKSNLRSMWVESVTEVFSSGAWRQISFQDIPDGEVKNAFYQKAKQAGIKDVKNYNRPCAPGEPPGQCGFRGGRAQVAAGTYMRKDPALPKKPGINGAVLNAELIRMGGKKKKSKGGNLALLLGAGALAYIFMKGRSS